MPTTLGGLVIFTAFLTPGFLNYIQRRRRVPQRSLSPLVEVATFISTSIATDVIALGVFSVVRRAIPTHTPSVYLMFTMGSAYIYPRIGYLSVWALALLTFSCVLGVIIGRWPGPLGKLLTPLIVDESAWSFAFDSAPKDSWIFLGCDLTDGTYVSGYLLWYNTDVDEVADRDLVLGAPIKAKSNGEEVELDFDELVISARTISRINVAYLDVDPEPDDALPSKRRSISRWLSEHCTKPASESNNLHDAG